MATLPLQFAAAQVAPAALGQQADSEAGVLIARVQRNSPAAKAGLRRGDILLKVNDTAVSEPQDIVDALAKFKSGDVVKLIVQRGDNETTLIATAADRNGKAYLGFTPVGQSLNPQPLPREMPGMHAEGSGNALGGAVAVEAVSKDSPADKAGLKVGDVIQAFDGKPLAGQPLQALVAAKKPGDVVTLTVTEAPATEVREVRVTLGEHPDKKGAAYLGIRYRPHVIVFSDEFKLPISAGAFVADVQADGPAAKAGVVRGDVITQFDGTAISETQMLIDAVAARKPGDAITITVLRDKESKILSLTLGEKSDAQGKALLGVQLGGLMRFEAEGGPARGFVMPIDPKRMPDLEDLFRSVPRRNFR